MRVGRRADPGQAAGGISLAEVLEGITDHLLPPGEHALLGWYLAAAATALFAVLAACCCLPTVSGSAIAPQSGTRGARCPAGVAVCRGVK